jgi:inhibitor of the pro-sigma K processing machinery
MDGIVSIIVALVVLFLIVKFFALSFVLFWNGLIGAIALWALNLLGAGLNITIFTSLIAGIFGIPGIIVLFLFFR